MKQNLYTIYDKVAKIAGPIWTAQNNEVAIRNFRHHIKEAQIASPQDFDLYQLASFDFEEMEISTEKADGSTAPIKIYDGQEIKNVAIV